jgi:hypothetical protein
MGQAIDPIVGEPPKPRKFRKKPIVIEAVQFKVPAGSEDKLPEGVTLIRVDPADNHFLGVYSKDVDGPGNLAFGVKAMSGWCVLTDGDWIVTGLNGEKYPCAADLFSQTYEEVTEPNA